MSSWWRLAVILHTWHIVHIYLSIYLHSGSGGSVVAGSLAEAGHNVILVEAGGHSPHLAHSPYLSIYLHSGSGGSVVAGRLAEAGHNVILVEAGGHSPHLAHIPVLGEVNFNHKLTSMSISSSVSLRLI